MYVSCDCDTIARAVYTMVVALAAASCLAMVDTVAVDRGLVGDRLVADTAAAELAIVPQIAVGNSCWVVAPMPLVEAEVERVAVLAIVGVVAVPIDLAALVEGPRVVAVDIET